MNEHRSLSILEHLPNELFFQIFEYMNAYDLHYGWSKLNQRFKEIVHSVPMYAHLTEKSDYNNYDVCFRHYPTQFIYVRIEETCGVSDTFDISRFPNIRSLHLGVVTDRQYDQITPDNLPYLTRLTINRVHAYRNPAFLLFGSKQFDHLTTCQLPYLLSTDLDLQLCLTVRFLYLKFCPSEIFFNQVKKLLPNLVSFESVSGTHIPSLNTNETKTELITSHKVLRHLRIETGRDTVVDFLPSLLIVLPELRCLILHCRFYCDYQQVADLLQSKLPRLKYFHFLVNESRFQRLPDPEILKCLSPWFAQVKLEQYHGLRRITCEVKK